MSLTPRPALLSPATVRCDRCGRDNPDHVTFCEDCGFSLKRQGPRPAAPAFVVGPVEPPVAAPAGASCQLCHTVNEAGFRFCVACGSPLGADPRPRERPTTPDGAAAVAVALRGAAQTPTPPVIAPTPPLAAAVQPVAAPQPSAAATCPRCRGAWDGWSRCAQCGFSATEARGLGSTLALEGRESAARPTEPRPPPFLSHGRVVMVGVDGRDGDAWPLCADQIDVGAREGEIVISDDPFLSPRHARLSREVASSVATWWVTDLSSVNGVYRRLTAPTPLRSGDLILLGQQVLRFDAVNDAEQALRPVHQHGTAVFGTPAVPCWARLCQRSVEGITRDVFHLRHDETTLGRESADIVFSRDGFLSRHHARVRRTPTGAVLEDLGSSNGTFVALTKREQLRDGDVLRMGLHMLRVELGAEGSR